MKEYYIAYVNEPDELDGVNILGIFDNKNKAIESLKNAYQSDLKAGKELEDDSFKLDFKKIESLGCSYPDYEENTHGYGLKLAPMIR